MRSAWILRGPQEDPRDASLVAPEPVDVHSIGGIPVLQPLFAHVELMKLNPPNPRGQRAEG
jgi:hypothetical protein